MWYGTYLSHTTLISLFLIRTNYFPATIYVLTYILLFVRVLIVCSPTIQVHIITCFKCVVQYLIMFKFFTVIHLGLVIAVNICTVLFMKPYSPEHN